MERENGTELAFTEFKGRSQKPKAREIPILPGLRTSIDACKSGHLTYLVTQFGQPFTANGFGGWFRKRCDEAGLPHCSAHVLRKAGATIAAERGASEHELMAIFGWESPKQAALYTRKANRKRLAKQAMHLIEPERITDLSVPPQTTELSHRPRKA
jgi:integrase